MGRNILVVEDDRNISDLIQMYLVKDGYFLSLEFLLLALVKGGYEAARSHVQKPHPDRTV